MRTSAGLSLLDAEAISKIAHLDILSRTVVDGLLAGSHRSIQKGGTFEFAEHRAYSAGDELRLIDWRIFGKRDRYFIKQFDEEINLQATMVVDASGSMGFRMSTMSKLAYAQRACACLSRLMLRQRDAVGLQCFAGGRQRFIPPRAHARHLHSLLETLQHLQPGGETTLAAALHALGPRLRRRGMVIIFSDCLGDLDELFTALRLLRVRGFQVILFHILAPEEMTFAFDGPTRFECLERNGLAVELEAAAIRRQYLERLRDFLQTLERECDRIRVECFRLTTDQSLGDALSYYLRLRAARMK